MEGKEEKQKFIPHLDSKRKGNKGMRLISIGANICCSLILDYKGL